MRDLGNTNVSLILIMDIITMFLVNPSIFWHGMTHQWAESCWLLLSSWNLANLLKSRHTLDCWIDLIYVAYVKNHTTMSQTFLCSANKWWWKELSHLAALKLSLGTQRVQCSYHCYLPCVSATFLTIKLRLLDLWCRLSFLLDHQNLK